MDLIDAIDAFISYAKLQRGYAEITLYQYKRTLMRFGEQQQLKEVSQITLKSIDDYITYLGNCGHSVNGVFNICLTLRAFMRYLNRTGANTLDHNLIDVPRRTKKPRKPLKMHEVQAILNNIHRERDRLLFLIAFSSGVRITELVNMKVEDVDGIRIQVTGKGAKTRTVRIHEIVAQRLMIYLTMEDISSGHIFLTTTGRPIGPAAVRHAIKQAAKRAGIERQIYPHILRHTFGAQYIENGGDVRSLQILMGHEQIQTTQVYMNMNDQWINEQYSKHKPQIVLTGANAHAKMLVNLDKSDNL